jgi:hypothetical protein
VYFKVLDIIRVSAMSEFWIHLSEKK